jgi:pimeloyl-ACP methyl ester carboxylesterase
LAADAPERVSLLVYLDSLTDYAGVGRIASRAPVKPPALPHRASDTVERAWHRAFIYGVWNDAVEADWRARPDAATLRHRRELLVDLLDDAMHAVEPFAEVRCPVLALLARESVATQFPWLKPDDPRRAAAETYLHDVRIPWRRASAERFRREVRQGRVAEVPGNHFFFLSAPQRTAAEIRGFLSST